MMARLGDLGEIITGNTPKTSEPENYASDDICFVKPSDISDGNVTIIERSEFYISEHARKKARILPPGSVLVTCIGIIGKVAINSVECAFNQQINAIIPDKSKCTTEYLVYAIQSQKKQLQSIANAPVVPIINKSQFSDITIPVPTISQQKYISYTLENVSRLIFLHKQQLSDLDKLITVRFVEMFGNPAKNDYAWEQQEMYKVAPVDAASGVKSGSIWLLNLDAIEPNTGRIIDYYYTDISNVGASTYAFDTENVLYSKLRPYLNKVVVPRQSGYCTTELIPLRPNERLNKQFLAFLLRSDSFVAYINEKVTGAKMPRVSMDVFREYKCILPPIDLQNQFADYVTQVEKSKAAVQSALDKAQLLFDSLMQKYFG